MDFLTGSFDGRPYWARATKDGYATPVMLNNGAGKELILGMWWDYDGGQWMDMEKPHGLSVAVVDWDADGDFDLVQGTSKGGLYLCSNEGTAQKPAFAEQGTPLKLEIPSGYAMPTVADWNGDGLFDLICGSDSGAIYLLQNQGSAGKPKFGAPQVLLAAHAGQPGTGPGTDTQVAVGDLNGDGLPDLMVGDQNSRRDVSHLTDAEQAQAEEVQQELAGMAEIIQAYYGDDEEAKSALDPKQVERLQELLQLQSRLSGKHIRSAHVWMYLQKAPKEPVVGLGRD